jgi:hypothetical protein
MAQPGFAGIAHHVQIAVGQTAEVADQVGAPVAAADNANLQSSVHECQGLRW